MPSSHKAFVFNASQHAKGEMPCWDQKHMLRSRFKGCISGAEGKLETGEGLSA